MPNLADIRAARERIRDNIVQTPTVPAAGLADALPGVAYFKLESLQRTGSFKDRGALNRLLDLTPDERSRGVVTASAGNHAQAVAYHGARLGIPVEVVMPEHTPLIKVANTRRFGAGVRFHGATLSEAMLEARRLELEEKRVLVHAFDDERVIAGQGTIGLELLEQLPSLTTVIVPIGGGGLISGIAVAIKEQRPDVRVFGVEATAAALGARSATRGTNRRDRERRHDRRWNRGQTARRSDVSADRALRGRHRRGRRGGDRRRRAPVAGAPEAPR
jgi:threonine dehydratase